MIRVSGIERRSVDDGAELAAVVHGLPGKAPFRLWIRAHGAAESQLSATGDAFLCALLPLAMHAAKPLRIDGEVSERLLAGCEQIISIWNRWDPQLRRIPVQAASSRRATPAGSGTGCFFTAGVDSFYTVLKHREFEQNRSPLTHLIFVRGYDDVPLDNERLIRRNAERLTQVAAALKVNFLEVSTNLRELILDLSHWGWDHFAGVQLACVGLALPGLFHRLLIPAGDTYSTLSPWGSHPLVDPLWSTEGLEFCHDGCEATRFQKLQWYVGRSQLALDHLRVCGYDTTGEFNCGTCEKCLRTMIGLEILGTLDKCQQFRAALDLERVRKLDGGQTVIRYYLRDNLMAAESMGARPELIAAVREALRPGAVKTWWRRLNRTVHDADQRWLGGRLRLWALSRVRQDAVSRSELRANPAKWFLQRLRGRTLLDG